VVVVDGVVDGVAVVGINVVVGRVVVSSSYSSGTSGVVMTSSEVLSLALSNKLAKVTPLDS